MANGIKSSTLMLFVVLVAILAIAQQPKPDFSGTWLLNGARSGPEPEIWLQRRPVRFIIHQTGEEVIIDTGDGSLFAVPAPVTETPLRYRLDGSIVTVLDRSLGDIPNFTRKISTEAYWESNSTRLLTLTTHFFGDTEGYQYWEHEGADLLNECWRPGNEG